MKEYQSKFRKNRSEREGGERAAANKLKGKPDQAAEEQMEEQVAPGIHEKLAARAREAHITHDHAAGRHHVHLVHEDGTESHSDHASAEEAHMQAANGAGVGMTHENPEGQANPESTGSNFEPNIE
jgi:hypothetical protein